MIGAIVNRDSHHWGPQVLESGESYSGCHEVINSGLNLCYMIFGQHAVHVTEISGHITDGD